MATLPLARRLLRAKDLVDARYADPIGADPSITEAVT
jgi:hypothetical protein